MKTSGRIPDIVVAIRGYFDQMVLASVATATILIRAPDSLTIDEHTFLSFLQMAHQRNIQMQLVFQYVKVFDGIKPLHL
jgi:hypothetical protein